MTSVVRYISGTSPFVGSTSGNDYQLVNVEVTIGAIAAGTATNLFTYTGAGIIKNIAFVQTTTSAGVLRSTANVDTFALDATNKVVIYTPQTANTVAGFVNLLLVIGNY